MLGLLGVLGLELVAWWELGATEWAHPHPALGFWQALGSVHCWGHWGCLH